MPGDAREYIRERLRESIDEYAALLHEKAERDMEVNCRDY